MFSYSGSGQFNLNLDNNLANANNLANNVANNFANNIANAVGPSIKCYEGEDGELSEVTCSPGFVCAKSVEEGKRSLHWKETGLVQFG